MSRIDELLQQRAAIDAELRELKVEAELELQAAKDRIAQLERALYVEINRPSNALMNMVLPHNGVDRNPIDETDAGMGVREVREQFDDAQSFTDELAEIRARSQARRRR